MFNELKNRFKFRDIWCFIIIKLSSINFKLTIVDYIEEFLPWRVHCQKGVTVTAGSTQLALQSVFTTLHIDSFFPKIDETIINDCSNSDLMGLGVDEGYGMTW